MRFRYAKGARVIDQSGQGPQGTVIEHKISCFGTVDCKVRWDDGTVTYRPTKYLKKAR